MVFFPEKSQCLITRRYTKKKIYNHIRHMHSCAIIDLLFIELGLILVWHGLTFLSFEKSFLSAWELLFDASQITYKWRIGQPGLFWALASRHDHLSGYQVRLIIQLWSCGIFAMWSTTDSAAVQACQLKMQSDHPLANCIDKSMGRFASRDWDILKWKSLWCLVCLSSVYHTLIGTM